MISEINLKCFALNAYKLAMEKEMTFKQQKVGDEIELICPDCDGNEEEMINCETCNKTGKVKGIVSRQ